MNVTWVLINLCVYKLVLEGKGVYLKKVNKWVTPKDGFNVMDPYQSNTKGKGSEDGRFIGTNILNESFLERFNYYYRTPGHWMDLQKKRLFLVL